MELFNKVITFLRKPFPQEESSLESLKIITVVSLFITFFLYLFQPFDMNILESNLFLICLGFGSMTFLASIIFEFGIARIVRLKGRNINFTFGRWVIYLIGLMFCISLANFIYLRLSFFGYILWEFFPHMIRGTFIMGIIPTVTMSVFRLLQQERKYLRIAASINEGKSELMENIIEDDSSILDIPVQRIRYVEALQNYVKIGHLDQEGKLLEQTERLTLKSIMDKAEGTTLVKCHRSYLVNQDSIISTSGNAQGLLLTLSDCTKVIPVSRSYVSIFRN